MTVTHSVCSVLCFLVIWTAATSAQQPSQAALDETVKIYSAAWSEPDATRRLDLLSRVWAPGGTYTDPQSHAEGREALAGVIGGFLQQYPGARIVPTSHADFHHGMIRFTWKGVTRDGNPIIEGIDFGVIGSDGKLERIVGFFGPVKPL